MKKFGLLLLLLLMAWPVLAKEAVPMAEDPVIEARLMDLSEELRCLVCQNQSLAASDSDFANDLRREMRDMMKRGMSDQEIIDFMVQRFGDFVLFNPPMKAVTVLLWFGPMLLLVVGVVVLLTVLRRRAPEETVISEADHRRAEALLKDTDNEGGQA